MARVQTLSSSFTVPSRLWSSWLLHHRNIIAVISEVFEHKSIEFGYFSFPGFWFALTSKSRASISSSLPASSSTARPSDSFRSPVCSSLKAIGPKSQTLMWQNCSPSSIQRHRMSSNWSFSLRYKRRYGQVSYSVSTYAHDLASMIALKTHLNVSSSSTEKPTTFIRLILRLPTRAAHAVAVWLRETW